MATNYFKIPILNPSRFVNRNAYDTRDPRYNTFPIDMKIDGQNPNGPYFQPWQLNDHTKFQLDSDFNDVTFEIKNFCDDTHYKDIAIAPVDVAIVGKTWKVYEAEISFADWDEGLYYGVISYTDENDVVQEYQTSGWDIREKHPKTLLYEYYSTYNDKGIIFDTGIKFSFRVEGLIREFTPRALTEDYIDQKYDVYDLNDIPYGTHNNYIGSARGLPDWNIKKMNTIFTVNSVKIDGQLFNKVSGQQFEVTRPPVGSGPNEDGWLSIQIIENFNGDQEQYKTGETPNTDLVVIQKVLKYYDNAANIAIPGIFKTHTNLVGLAIWNKGADAFNLKVGTTNGGSEIGEYGITDDVTSFVLIEKVFNVATTIYLTGLVGTNLDIDVDYKDYDAPQSAPPIPGSGGFIPNVEYTYYEDNAGDFDIDWNLATGMGRPDTDFENCFLLTGQNGCIDDAGNFRIGMDKDTPGTRGTVIGAIDNFTEITREVLPAEGIATISNSINPTDGDVVSDTSTIARASNIGNKPYSYTLLKGQTGLEPNLGISAKLGDGDPFDITPMSLVVARFIYRRP